MSFGNDGQIRPMRKAWGEALAKQKPLAEMKLNAHKRIGLDG